MFIDYDSNDSLTAQTCGIFHLCLAGDPAATPTK